MANITDRFVKVINGTTRPVATTLSAQKLSGAATASVVSTTGWDTDTAVHGIMYRTDASGAKVAGSQIDFKATVSGTTLSNFTVTAGNDDTYAIGTTVVIAPTAAWGDDMATGILVGHSQTGNHQFTNVYDPSNPTLETLSLSGVAAAVNNVRITNSVTGTAAKIEASGDDTNVALNLAGKGTGEVQLGGVNASGGWQTFTPTWTGNTPTIGNGTLAGAYKQIGKTVHFWINWTAGTTTTYGTGTWSFGLPVTAGAGMPVKTGIGTWYGEDAGVTAYFGVVRYASTTTVDLIYHNKDFHGVPTTVAHNAPYVWGTNDFIHMSGTYEAA